MKAHQKGSLSLDYAFALTAILEQVLLGQEIGPAIDRAKVSCPDATLTAIQTAVAHKHGSQADVTQVREHFTWSCSMLDGRQGVMHAAIDRPGAAKAASCVSRKRILKVPPELLYTASCSFACTHSALMPMQQPPPKSLA